ncbi:MAG TPA: hypothetical protein VLM37_06370 [Fibrobacteraceae bacterium]|nr:hypothetical protein [Fibrobacteraceae bacterium]
MTRMGWLCFWSLGCALVNSCDRQDAVDADVVNLYVDLRVAGVEYGSTADARFARQNLMREAGYDVRSFSAAIMEIRSNPELWLRFQQMVMARLDSLRESGSSSHSLKSKKDMQEKK